MKTIYIKKTDLKTGYKFLKNLIKIKYLVITLPLSYIADAQTPANLQTEIKNKHGIHIVKSRAKPDSSAYLNEGSFNYFLTAFLNSAEQKELSKGDEKRFFPVRIKIRVYPENWNPLNLAVSYLGPDLAFDGNTLKVGHKSAEETVSFLITHFPLENNEEALELNLRNQAIRQAIIDKIKYARENGITVKSCSFSASFCSLKEEADIAYSTQEKLLQGLINLEKAIDSGEETRTTVRITLLPWFWEGSQGQSWNRWFENDEQETENLILDYMFQLQTQIPLQTQTLNEVSFKGTLNSKKYRFLYK